jgi:hypothetical protein
MMFSFGISDIRRGQRGLPGFRGVKRRKRPTEEGKIRRMRL